MKLTYLIRLLLILFLWNTIHCGKANYLKAGESALVTEKQGVFIRTEPSMTGKKVILVPFNQQISVIEEGSKESLYDINSRWYRVAYQGKTGWMWGGLAKTKDSANTHKQEHSMIGGKCNGLLDYAQKNFKKLSGKPERGCSDDFPSNECGVFNFEGGIRAEGICGCHSYEITLELPGASFEDGFKILTSCGSTSDCEGLSFSSFREAHYDSKNLKNCRNDSSFYEHFKIHQQGGRLIIHKSSGGI